MRSEGAPMLFINHEAREKDNGGSH